MDALEALIPWLEFQPPTQLSLHGPMPLTIPLYFPLLPHFLTITNMTLHHLSLLPCGKLLLIPYISYRQDHKTVLLLIFYTEHAKTFDVGMACSHLK